jgi:DNA-binding SARP family transcriptional activator
MLEVKVLGSPEIRVDGRPVQFPNPLTLALTVYLALEGSTNRVHLQELFWEDEQTDLAQAKLSRELHRLRSIWVQTECIWTMEKSG